MEYNIEAIADLISAHTTTLVFANTRKMTETIVQKLRPFLGDLVAGHHGSMDKNIRLDVEKEAEVWPSPGRCDFFLTRDGYRHWIGGFGASSWQPGRHRNGASAHRAGRPPRGWDSACTFLPTGVDDLIELAALQAAIQTGDMDRLDFPQNCLDVVAQFIIGLVIINELDIDEAYEIIVNSWSYRNFEYDDFIEVLDMLEEERRIWIDWEENIFGKRGYSRMIYYTNIGTIAPDNSYLVFNAEGSILGKLSGSFVSNLRTGDVILFGGSTYRVTNIQGTRVNVSSVWGTARPFRRGRVRREAAAGNCRKPSST